MTAANTQQQQPKKFDLYLVNDDSLERLKILASECCHSIEDEQEVEDIMQEIRSRPHPAPTAGAQQQRIEQVIKELEKRIEQSKDEVAQAKRMMRVISESYGRMARYDAVKMPQYERGD